MPLRATIDSRQLREASKIVREIDPEIRKGFVRDLKADLRPYANKIVRDIPGRGKPPLSGMGGTGRLSWGSTQAGVYVNPAGGRGSLARIEIFGRAPYRAGLKMVDLAGTSNYTATPQGRAMITNPKGGLEDRFPLSANGRGGRFIWKGFMKHRPAFVRVVIDRLDQYSDEITRRMRFR
jgi:hypothetical protein